MQCTPTDLSVYVYTDSGVKNISYSGTYNKAPQTVYLCRDFVKHNGTQIWKNTYNDGMTTVAGHRGLKIGNYSYFGRSEPFKIYGFKFWEDRSTGILAHDLVPGMLGKQVLFYDKATGAFVIPEKGEYIAGNGNEDEKEEVTG